MAAPQNAQLMSHPAQPNAAGCQLAYGGGPLLQNVKVFDVFYNTGNPYKAMLTSYYTAIVQSSYFDWLSEYNSGSYKIGRGSFLGFYEDNKSTTTQINLDDSQIGGYLDGLISANKIPAPDADTIYQIYFPSNVSITLQGSQSCQVFCAYHNGWMHNGQQARYSVIPDVTKAPCAGGCGGSMNQFENLTSVSSHELIEAVTDPDNNSAWVDQTQGCGEIGDICNGTQCTKGASDSTGCPGSYVVQLEWSNKLNACIANNPAVKVNDFTVAATPTTIDVPQGGTATVMIAMTKSVGTGETAALTATGPTGVTGAFSPASASTDAGKSTLTISAAATAMLGMGKVTVKAAATSSSHTVDVAINVVSPPDMAMQPDLAQPAGGGNGGTGGGGSGGTGTGGNGNGGGNGNHGGDSGCSIGGGSIAGSWAFAGLVLLALAFRRRRA